MLFRNNDLNINKKGWVKKFIHDNMPSQVVNEGTNHTTTGLHAGQDK